MSKLALSGLAMGAAMAVGTAQAEPLTLSADQMDQVTAAGFGVVDFDAFPRQQAGERQQRIDKDVLITKTIDKDVFITRLFGEADARTATMPAASAVSR
jgi:hypothetical protein